MQKHAANVQRQRLTQRHIFEAWFVENISSQAPDEEWDGTYSSLAFRWLFCMDRWPRLMLAQPVSSGYVAGWLDSVQRTDA